MEDAHDRRRKAGSQGPGEDRLQSQSDDFATAFGNHCRQAPDKDSQAPQIGESAERVGHDDTASRFKRLGRQGGEIQIGDEFVEDDLGAKQCPGVGSLRPGNAGKPGKRRQGHTQQPL